LSKTLLAHLSLFIVNTLYGASHVLAKGVMPKYLTPNVFILFRALGATLLFWMVCLIYGRNNIERTDLPRLVACGFFGVALNQLCFFHGLNLSSAINSGIIMAFNPIIVVILSYFILKDKISLTQAVGIFLGSSGAILLTLTAGTGQGDSVQGDLLLFINSASYAIYLVLAKPLMQKYSPLTVITWVFTIGAVFVLLFPPLWGELLLTKFSSIPGAVWIKIIYVIVGVTFLTYLLTMFGLKYLSASVSSTYIYFQPVQVMLFAYLFTAMGIADNYTATITWQKIIYMLVIFVGVYVASRKTLQIRVKG
jgi:drug/metabolite transporter (DMT)-like permease